MLRTCLAAAAVDGTVSVVVEPIALYHERDLLASGRRRLDWRRTPPRALGGEHVPIGRARTWGDGARPHDRDVRQRAPHVAAGRDAAGAARASASGSSTCAGWRRCRSRTCSARLAPPAGCSSSTRPARAGGISEGLVTGLLEAGFDGRLARIAGDDSFVPLGAAASLVLVSEQDVEDAARLLLS